MCEMKWIPVSERLPKREQRCIISVEYPSYMTRRSDVVIDRWVINSGRQIGMFEERAGFWMHHSKQEVTAWLPLPEPYQNEVSE